MNTRFTSLLAALALGIVLAPVALADPPADKGNKGGKSQQYDDRDDDHGKSKDKSKDKGGDPNHGSVVSECSHRANERNLKGQDRKEWTEWCEERGSRHNYDYRRYSSDRNCYQQADSKRLSGDQRRRFINDCLDRPNRY
jgi:hypothetical protein